MKKRLGFVSNSSSSSFVVFGIPFDDSKYTEDEIDALYEEYMILYPDEADVPETIIGVTIADIDTTSIGEVMTLTEMMKPAKELVKKFNLTLDDVKV